MPSVSQRGAGDQHPGDTGRPESENEERISEPDQGCSPGVSSTSRISHIQGSPIGGVDPDPKLLEWVKNLGTQGHPQEKRRNVPRVPEGSA